MYNAHAHAHISKAPRAATTPLLPYYGTTTMKPTISTSITFEVLGEADGVVTRVGAAAGLNVLAHELAHLFVVRGWG